MLFNVVFGLLLPWIVGLWLCKRETFIVLVIAPISSVLAFVINEIGVQLGYWVVFPVLRVETLSVYPLTIGLYPVLGSLMIYSIKVYKVHPMIAVLALTTITTISEILFVIAGKAVYGNGWNSFYTFLSYFIPYSIVYFYYTFLMKLLKKDKGIMEEGKSLRQEH
ncbi:hypothetical protein [Bacillus solitudinis]|uniref:hypothetical protein n=1 Tax=Bacillus solitudinis TaxID=2014074 RepID=UPI000C23BFC1|nr:hypothetical protein [Bacillus solitudinis]